MKEAEEEEADAACGSVCLRVCPRCSAPSSAIRSTAQFCMAFLGSGLPSLVGGVCACVAASRIESFHERVQDLMAGE